MEDMEVTPTERTRRVIEGSMNGVFGFLDFTMETPEDFGGWLPTLDTNLQVSLDNIINYKFFQKEMAANTVIRQETAMDENSKSQILSNDMTRRTLTTGEMVNQKVRNRVMDGYSQMLANSGYSLEKSRTMIMNGLT